MDEAYDAEEELKLRQNAALYPLGRALRQTYDAENHDSLGTDVTGLMLELTRLPFEPAQPCVRDAPAAPAAAAGAGMMARIRGLLGRGPRPS